MQSISFKRKESVIIDILLNNYKLLIINDK